MVVLVILWNSFPFKSAKAVSLQDLAVGADVDGLKVKDPMRTLLPVLLHPYSTQDKIRAVLLYIFSLGGSPQ